MLTTLTPLASGGHADSELWCPQRLQCQSFVVLIPPFLWHCHTLSLLMLTETNSTSKSLSKPSSDNLIRQALYPLPTHSGSVLAQGSPKRWPCQSAQSKPFFATSHTSCRSSNEATSIIAAPILDQNTVACLH